MHDQNCFITLTYAEPAESEDLSDLTKFIKKLRHKADFRYLGCGESGDLHGRWHYHLACFGQDFLGGARKTGETSYENSLVTKNWGKGIVHIDQLTPEACFYVAAYSMKKINQGHTVTCMSKRPAIGSQWLDKYSENLVRTGRVIINGRSFKTPERYYDLAKGKLDPLKASHREYMESLEPVPLQKFFYRERSRDANQRAARAHKAR